MNTPNEHWASSYIGKPWRVASDGPDAFDCWGLVVEVQRRLFGRRMDTIHVEPENLRLLIRTIRQHPIRREWQPNVYQREGDLALLRQSRHPVHVGVWLDVDGGGVLHCLRGCGVVFQTLASLRLSGWQIESFYTYIGDLNHDRNGHPSPQPVSAGTQP